MFISISITILSVKNDALTNNYLNCFQLIILIDHKRMLVSRGDQREY